MASSSSSSSSGPEIQEVWHSNLHSAFLRIRDLVDELPYVAMDTEFPGVIHLPFVVPSPNPYSDIKANVDKLKLIQLGLTFSDADPLSSPVTFQFNFRDFNPERDPNAAKSIALLRESGIDFDKFIDLGVDSTEFAELLMSSGVVLNDDVHWITFHSGYDFGYLLKILTCQYLPESEDGFFKLIQTFFPRVYDVKYLIKFCDMHGGLNGLADKLKLKRIGKAHQAGSDSLLTTFVYRKLKQAFFHGSPEQYAGVLFGLGVDIANRSY